MNSIEAYIQFEAEPHRRGSGRHQRLESSCSFEREAIVADPSWMAERQKMLAGELYDPLDPELVAGRERARDLCQALNSTREAQLEERRRILSELFGTGGDSVWMQPPFFCDYGVNIELGERVFFNFNCVVLDVCRVRIGDFTLFGPAVQIYTPMHPLNADQRRREEFGKPVDIGADVWVGGGAIILPGVRIGSRTVIGAGSVVTRDVPDGVFAAGNPCRVIREIRD
jgi:maltose O-acetyltransferase